MPQVPGSVPNYEAPNAPPDHPRMADPSNDTLVGTHPTYNNPIRVIPTHISIRQFSGSETDYTSRQFLDLCEAAIVN